MLTIFILELSKHISCAFYCLFFVSRLYIHLLWSYMLFKGCALECSWLSLNLPGMYLDGKVSMLL